MSSTHTAKDLSFDLYGRRFDCFEYCSLTPYEQRDVWDEAWELVREEGIVELSYPLSLEALYAIEKLLHEMSADMWDDSESDFGSDDESDQGVPATTQLTGDWKQRVVTTNNGRPLRKAAASAKHSLKSTHTVDDDSSDSDYDDEGAEEDIQIPEQDLQFIDSYDFQIDGVGRHPRTFGDSVGTTGFTYGQLWSMSSEVFEAWVGEFATEGSPYKLAKEDAFFILDLQHHHREFRNYETMTHD